MAHQWLSGCYTGQQLPVVQGPRGFHMGLSGQDLAARACPITPVRRREAGGTWVASASGTGQWGLTEARLECGSSGGPGSVGPMIGQWRAGDQYCCGLAGLVSWGWQPPTWNVTLGPGQSRWIPWGPGRDSQCWWYLQGLENGL